MVMTFYILLAAVIVFVTFKYLLGIILPFLIAYLISLIFRPIFKFIVKKTNADSRLLSIITILLLLLILGGIIFFITSRLWQELSNFVHYLSTDSDNIIRNATDFLYDLEDKIPFLNNIETDIVKLVSDILKSFFSNLSLKLPELITSMVKALPDFLFSLIITVMASYYMCADHEKINEFMFSFTPEKYREKLIGLKKHVFLSLGKIVRAYILLSFITFLQVLAGLLLLKVEYAFSISLLIAAIDVLPVLGSSFVLIPWVIVLFLQSNYYLAIGLIIIFFVVWVTRRVIEPKIVGSSVGLNPLATLLAMYVGLKLFGLIGFLLSPFAVLIIQKLLEKNKKKAF